MTCIAPRCKEPRELGALFCVVHLKSPAAQRGGWLSAERRRRMMAASKESVLDASNIMRRLWIGGQPPFDRDLPEFDVLVLCAQELQPQVISFSKKIIRCGIPDSALSSSELRTALVAGRQVAHELSKGKRCLVTCAMGINRSALVTGLAMGLVYRMSANQIIEHIRKTRNPMCLSNTEFQKVLHRFIGAGVPAGGRG